ncbi:PapD-like protein [Gilbertella persicaria]|uniref:PapD-like protein n=1 Tax=Gilbertella persicaria TaxID=101096 RepID=UPI00221E5272|nr:PapD-like protein [Gilbertella persicaria]KAI8076552.1 PapD-like protein [Gilbertella persicaria]
MSIQLDLEDNIAFERPLTRIVKQHVRIDNPHGQAVAFKVKTTAPKLYCVRPNSDIIPPHGSIQVQIMLQAFKEEPPLDVKCRDKFLILSTFLNEVTENMNLQELWSHVEEKEKSSIHQRKLRCLYVNPAEQVTVTKPTQPKQVVEPTQHEEEDVEQKMKRMEEELDKYKKQVEELREVEPMLEKQVKTSGYPISLFILMALFIAAVAYFVHNNK